MSVAIPPQAPAKKSGMMWLAIIVVAAGGYYYYTHHVQPQGPQPANPPATQPGPAPQPGTPGGTPGPAAPVQPGDPGPGGPNDALVQQQAFNGQWRVANGYVQIYNARWMNRSNATMQSATLECDQYAQNGEVLSQQRITLNGTNPPGGTWTTNNNSPFNMGQAMQGLSNVNCGIVAVTPAQ
jgi:cell division protein FtsN